MLDPQVVGSVSVAMLSLIATGTPTSRPGVVSLICSRLAFAYDRASSSFVQAKMLSWSRPAPTSRARAIAALTVAAGSRLPATVSSRITAAEGAAVLMPRPVTRARRGAAPAAGRRAGSARTRQASVRGEWADRDHLARVVRVRRRRSLPARPRCSPSRGHPYARGSYSTRSRARQRARR